MNLEKRSCECHCPVPTPIQSMAKIVITGGPGAGKTALLESVKKIFCQHVAILPEAASILFGGGFWRLESHSAKNAAQRAIFHIQKETEQMAYDEECWAVALCDRGSLDGLAYWQGPEAEFFRFIDSDKKTEQTKYHGVIHLRTPDEKNGYNHQNPVRNEPAHLAQQIDQRIYEIWSSHPNYVSVASSADFLTKVEIGTREIYKMSRELLAEHRKKIAP